MHVAPFPAHLGPPLACSSSIPTFAEALHEIGLWSDLVEVRRRDLASALRTASRMLGLPPAAVPCDAAWLNAHMFEKTPATFGISHGRFRNVVAGLRAVLRRLGTHAPDLRTHHDLPAAWQALLAVVPHPAKRGALAAFARFCAAAGSGPEGVTDAVLAAFVEAERRTRLSAATQGRARTIAAAWNGCVRAKLPGWPNQLLAAARQRQPYALRLNSYSASFQQEVAAFQARLSASSGRFLIGEGSHRRLRQASIDARVFAIRQAAGLLVRSGIPAGEFRGLRDLVSPIDRVATVLDVLAEAQAARSGVQHPEGGQLGMVAETLRQIATFHVELDPAEVAQITTWARQAAGRKRGRGMTVRNRDRLRALVSLNRRALLLHLPAELMRRATAIGAGTMEAGRLARTAVALEILLVCPLRRRSLLALRLDEHLQRLDARGRRITHLVLKEVDTKNATPFEWPLPPEAADLIDRYVRDFRGVLTTPENPWLFPSRDGVLSPNRLTESLEETIAREVGVEVNVHLLRHFAAWLFLRANPSAYEDVRRVLGHRSIETTIGHYVAFEAAMAAERFDATVLAERRSTRAVAAARWGKRPVRRSGGTT